MNPIGNSRLFIEIHEQPEIIKGLVNDPPESIPALAEEIRKREITQVFIAARGTSDNAGRYAKYLLGAHNRMIVSLAAPSLFTIYKKPPDLHHALILGISQSGKSPDIVSVLAEGKKQGALTAAITNFPESDLGKQAEWVLPLNAGEEKSLAATKTYTAELVSLALLSAQLDSFENAEMELKQLPNILSQIFELEAHIDSLAERYRYMSHCTVIGRGYNYASAFEFSLKMKELTYTIAEPYSSADFLHGPVALVDRGFPVFVIAPSGKMAPEMKALVGKIQEREAEVIMISDQSELLNMADHKMTLPTDIPEWLSPIPAILPAQMFAMYLAHTRGFDVDNPRGLNKVTETW
jgi:glucosamine--fructose-6-phosphate aminotransferase (isomerizing)